MDIFVGYAGLTVSFLILVVMMLSIFIKADNIHWKVKLLTIPLVLAYSIVLYSTVQNFLGYPTPRTKNMGEVILLDVHIVEDDAFYFWVLDFNKRNVLAQVMPSPPESMKPDAPIYIMVKYNTALHKELVKMTLDLKKQRRGGIKINMEKLNGFTSFSKNKKPFKLYDPAKVLKKISE